MIYITAKVKCAKLGCKKKTDIEIGLTSASEYLSHQEERSSYGDRNDHSHHIDAHNIDLVKMEVIKEPENWFAIHSNEYLCPKCKED